MDLKHAYSDAKFVNLSMNAIGITGKSSESLLLMLDDLHTEKSAQNYITKKVMNIILLQLEHCTTYSADETKSGPILN